MRIGIVTFYHADNYGAVLQAYALQEYLRQAGYLVKIIRYNFDYQPPVGPPRQFRRWFAERAGRSLLGTYLKWQQLWKRSRFRRFREQCLDLSAPYANIDELASSSPDCEVYVCGSDQVWNPDYVSRQNVRRACFLDFGSPSVMRIAYSASFGCDALDQSYRKQNAPLLRRFFRISVREASAVPLVRQLTGQDAVCLPDPTLLLERAAYEKLAVAHPAVRRNYVFFYGLSGIPATELVGLQRRLRQDRGQPILSPFPLCLPWSDFARSVYPDPRQWLFLIANAAAVVTNSFHGTVFSILYERPFVSLRLRGRMAGRNNRMASLLERVGLADRLIDARDHDAAVSLLEQPIAWEAVRERLADWGREADRFWREVFAEAGRADLRT